MTTSDKAPRAPRAPRAPKATAAVKPPPGTPGRGPGKASADDKLADALAQTYAGIGLGLGKALPLFGTDPRVANAVGQIIAAAGPDAAASWVTLAKANPAVRKQLVKFTEAGGWGSVIFAHVGLGMTVAMALRAPTPEVAELLAAMAASPEMAAAMGATLNGAPAPAPAGD